MVFIHIFAIAANKGSTSDKATFSCGTVKEPVGMNVSISAHETVRCLCFFFPSLFISFSFAMIIINVVQR